MSKSFKHALLAGTAAAALAIGTAGPASAVVFNVTLGFSASGFDGVTPTTLDGSASFSFDADPGSFVGLDNIALDSLTLSPSTIGSTVHDTSNTVGAVTVGFGSGSDGVPGPNDLFTLSVALGGSAGGGAGSGFVTPATDEDDFGALFFAKIPTFTLQDVVDSGGASLFFDSAFISNADEGEVQDQGFNISPSAFSTGSGGGSGFISVAQIPAPGGLGFLGLGLIALGWYRRRQRA